METDVIELEIRLLSYEARHNKDELAKLIDKDFIEFGASGRIYDYHNIIARLPDEQHKMEYTITKIDKRILSENLTQVLYTIKTLEDGHEYIANRSSIWKKEGGNWKMLFHQGTKQKIEEDNKMNYLVISGNPKQNGLCRSVTEEVIRGAKDGGAVVSVLETAAIPRCHVCGEGWGSCRTKHECAFGNDGFSEAQAAAAKADAYCIITPVYWGEASESLKAFIDRLRRCEASKQWAQEADAPKSVFAGKQVLLVASPGGSGNGALTCLEQMDRFCRHTGAAIFDCIGVNRWNSDYKKQAAYQAARAMAEGRRAGETVSGGKQ
jgi:multimeric flavodoxin WrbA